MTTAFNTQCDVRRKLKASFCPDMANNGHLGRCKQTVKTKQKCLALGRTTAFKRLLLT